jgi:hypothetical protein
LEEAVDLSSDRLLMTEEERTQPLFASLKFWVLYQQNKLEVSDMCLL